jgi:deoxyribonuclease V
MFACVDVDYRKTDADADAAMAACLVFGAWSDPLEASRHVERVAPVEPYEPGQFYRRELPCVLRVLARVTAPLDVVVVDGYVWLDSAGRRGLGAHLHAALGGRAAVIGVAKSPFRDVTAAVPVCRGASHNPLYVTAAGVDVRDAARWIASMDGPYRVPTLLRRVDQLCRAA